MSRPSFQTGYRRALALRCPVCGQSKLFSGFFRMNETCSSCGLKYERDPGYFLGSTYFNYGWTCLSMTFAYLLLHFVMGWPNKYVTPPLLAYAIIFPLFFFRYARALWLAFDCYFDHTGLPSVETNDPATDETSPRETSSENPSEDAQR